jgi:hypothetical protein
LLNLSDKKPVVHIDVLTPKQVLFFEKIIKMLEDLNVEVLVTSRRYREVDQLLELKKLKTYVVGSHGGKSLEKKLVSSSQRILKLTKLLHKIKPNVSVSHSSPETARVSFGLGIPHLCVNDSPHSEAVARLTVPLSKKLLTPSIIPLKAWLKFGLNKKLIVRYKALDPVVWLRDFQPNPKILSQLGISASETIVVVRPEETYASYLLKQTGGRFVYMKIVERLLEELDKDVVLVVLPRYKEQLDILKRTFNGRIIVPERVIDATSLLFYSSIFVGGGGTMNTEAALLGVPTFSFYPGKPTYIEKFLSKKGLLKRVVNPKSLTRKIVKTLKNLDEVKKVCTLKARKLILNMEDPAKVVVKTISDYL